MTLLVQARQTAATFAEMIREHCQRLEIAGSIRRKKPEVKDAELVGIPLPTLLPMLDEMLESGLITKALYGAKNQTRWGDKLRGFVFNGVKIELFLTDTDGWGFQYWLRTGPAEAGSQVMKAMNWRSDFRAIDGHIYYSSKWQLNGEKWEAIVRSKLSLPEEVDFFHVMGLLPVAPEYRRVEAYQVLWNKQHEWGNANDFIKRYTRPLRHDNSRYGMLPPYHAQRWDYENNAPSWWRHRLLPLQIAELEKRIAQLRAEGRDVFDLERLLEADKARLEEGEQAIREGTMRQ